MKLKFVQRKKSEKIQSKWKKLGCKYRCFNVVIVAYKMSIHLAAVNVGATSETKDMFQS